MSERRRAWTLRLAHLSGAVTLAGAVSASAPAGSADLWGTPAPTRVGERLTLVQGTGAQETRVQGTGQGQQAFAEDFGSAIAANATQIIVAAEGQTDVVGAPPVTVWQRPGTASPGDSGAAPALGWRCVQDLLPLPLSGPSETGRFGASLAANDAWLFVGAPETTVNGITAAGAVHVYQRAIDGSWTGGGVLLDATPTPGARFGAALDLSGSTLAVGVPGRAPLGGGAAAGGADLFVVASEGVTLAASYTVPSNLAWSAAFGSTVAVDGTRLAIGDPGATIVPGVAPGMALMLTVAGGSRGQSTTVLLEQLLTVSDLADGAGFAMDLDLDGDRLVVAAPGGLSGDASQAGAVHLYEHASGAWQPTAVIDGEAGGSAYERCRLHGDLLAIGAAGHGNASQPESGGAWLVRLTDNGPAVLASITADPTLEWPTRHVGRSVALTGDTLAIAETLVFPTAWASRGSVRVLPLAESLDDCNGDGATNLAAVLAGEPDCNADCVPDTCPSIADCDGNGVPDACDSRWIDAWNLDAPIGPTWWGIMGHGPFDDPIAGIFVVRCIVPAGSDGIIRGVSADWIAYDGVPQPCAVSIYLDPDQDGDPADAQVLWKSAVRPTVGPGVERVVCEPLLVGPPGTTYFLGFAVARFIGTPFSMSLKEFAFEAGAPHITWVGFNNPEDLDIDVPSANLDFGNGYSTNLAVAGLFAAPADLDADGVLDACACPADLSGDGAVGPSDLAILLGAWGGPAGDVDGDGTTAPVDLALLLGEWGPC